MSYLKLFSGPIIFVLFYGAGIFMWVLHCCVSCLFIFSYLSPIFCFIQDGMAMPEAPMDLSGSIFRVDIAVNYRRKKQCVLNYVRWWAKRLIFKKKPGHMLWESGASGKMQRIGVVKCFCELHNRGSQLLQSWTWLKEVLTGFGKWQTVQNLLIIFLFVVFVYIFFSKWTWDANSCF